jgi:hypothetical protein
MIEIGSVPALGVFRGVNEKAYKIHINNNSASSI